MSFEATIKRDDILFSRDVTLEAEMRVAEAPGQFNNAAARKVYRNDGVSIPGKNFDQGSADPTHGARNDDDASCLHHKNFSRAPFSGSGDPSRPARCGSR
ncbi:hypothetical protein MPL1032_220026 [Mesorhizobium plurifarium]|uniref:Uncharacterized protein n=1 Tax=Mesorhizobium plurifarium TaxID=69974 RepID=A0A0K2VZI8_MESPL|nr:hypothetical protein MPL1032_220026 [Mesorhizobium plurifarium]